MGEKDIEQKCLRLIDENGAEALKSDGFENVTLETVKKIISRDTLEINELDVWQACLRWAEKECQRQDKQVSIFVEFWIFVHGKYLSIFSMRSGYTLATCNSHLEFAVTMYQ